MEKQDVKMPSGASLKINVAPFEVSKALYQAILEECKGIAVGGQTDLHSVYKDLFCIGFSSKKIEACVWACFEKCTYDGTGADLRISKDTFEPLSARDDYMTACMEVTKANVLPFAKSLYAEYGHILREMKKDQK
jgi:hypothetical protein